MKYLIGCLLIFQFWYGACYMWFHQDDLNWMKLAQNSWSEQLTIPVTEHINYLFRGLNKAEYELFGWNFRGYLGVSLLLHLVTICMVGLLTAKVTKRSDFGYLAAGLFTINTNWNEVVLWASGQTISISVFFTLIVLYYVVNEERWWKVWPLMLLASMTSGLTAWLPIAVSLIYWKRAEVRWSALSVLMVTIVIYLSSSSGVGGEIGRNVVQMIMVAILGVVNTVMGRLWWPFEIGERVRIGITLLLIAINYNLLPRLLRRKETLLLMVSIAMYYAMVAIGRAQYGVGMMRAERYAYMGLALVLPVLFYGMRELNTKWLRWGVGMLMVIQVGGFVVRANSYIERPQQLRDYYQRIEELDRSRCYRDEVMPWFIFQNENTKLSEYASLWNDLVIGGEECEAI